MKMYMYVKENNKLTYITTSDNIIDEKDIRKEFNIPNKDKIKTYIHKEEYEYNSKTKKHINTKIYYRI